MKVCLVQEGEPYKVIYASLHETPYRILKENHVLYETRDVFLNGRKIDNSNILNPISSFKVNESSIFISVKTRI